MRLFILFPPWFNIYLVRNYLYTSNGSKADDMHTWLSLFSAAPTRMHDYYLYVMLISMLAFQIQVG